MSAQCNGAHALLGKVAPAVFFLLGSYQLSPPLAFAAECIGNTSLLNGNATDPPPATSLADGISIKNAFANVDSGKFVNFIDFGNNPDPCGASVCMDPELHVSLTGASPDPSTPKCNWPVVACASSRVEQIALFDSNLGQITTYAAAMTGELLPALLPDSLRAFRVRTMPRWNNIISVTQFPPGLMWLELQTVGWGGSDLEHVFHSLPNMQITIIWETAHSGAFPALPMPTISTPAPPLGETKLLSLQMMAIFYWLPNLDEGPLPDLNFTTNYYPALFFYSADYCNRRGSLNFQGLADSAPSMLGLGLAGNNFAEATAADVLVPMPSAMMQLTLHSAGLTGTIDWMATFRNALLIQYLIIDYNSLSGDIPFDDPASLGSALEYFGIAHNQFTSTATTIDVSSTRFAALGPKFFRLSYNNFDFDTFVWTDVAKLLSFACSKCGLEGTFSNAALALPASPYTIYNLELDDNNFTSYDPSGTTIPYTTSLSRNQFSGTFPWSQLVASTPGTVRGIAIDHNNYSGTIDWAHVVREVRMELSHNQFEGTVDWSAFSNMGTQFTRFHPDISIHHNKLTGPVDFGSFSSYENTMNWLHAIRINNNEFEDTMTVDSLKPLGSISGVLSHSELRELDLSGNRLNGTIDLDMSYLPRLYRFHATQANTNSCALAFVNQDHFLQRWEGKNSADRIDWTSPTLIDPEMVRDTDITRTYLEEWNRTCIPTPEPTPAPPVTEAPSTARGSSGDDTPVGAIVGGVLGGLLCCSLCAALIFCCMKKRGDEAGKSQMRNAQFDQEENRDEMLTVDTGDRGEHEQPLLENQDNQVQAADDL